MQNRSIGVNVVSEGSSDFFGNHDSPQIVHPTDDTSSFHIYLSPYFTNYDAIICKIVTDYTTGFTFYLCSGILD